jgi:hypothetical protein
VIDLAWTEPFLIFGLAATVLSALRWPRATPYVLGAFLVMKQYLVLVLALPLSWLLLPAGLSWSQRAQWALRAAAVACALTLPMVQRSDHAPAGASADAPASRGAMKRASAFRRLRECVHDQRNAE